jgi:molybdate transport system substrate-binding protein
MLILVLLLLLPLPVLADEALIAVASNFNTVLEGLRDDFEASTSHVIELSSGSTGALYAQVVHGAPFDAILAADQARPIRLEEDGFGVAGTRFTYAEGRLAFWSQSPDVISATFDESLRSGRLRKLAIANPELAPYGVAAREALQSTGSWPSIRDRLVYGQNVSQAFSMAALGAVDAAIVALSNVVLTNERLPGYYLEIPTDLYAPIRQDAILLQHGADNEAARGFLEFLQSDAVRAKIASYGY